jgi:hypothetical protein
MMMYFGKKSKLVLIHLVIIFFSISLYSSPVAKLTKNKILKGEPLQLHLEFERKANIEIPKSILSENGVTAEYLGSEENISIINGNVSQKKILKFRIVTSKDGSLQTPKIQIIENGQLQEVPPLPFIVSKQKYVPLTQDLDEVDSFFDQVFGYHKRKNYQPQKISQNDVHVFFHLNRDKVYVGETIVGYFTLYYKNLPAIYFERNDYKAVEFPYFSSELLSDVTIETPSTDEYRGEIYNVQPYQREVYALTPLKKGTYEIGKASFSLLDSGIEMRIPQMTIQSKTKKVQVLDLPQPVPLDFSGEVGDYQITIQAVEKEISLGEPIHLDVIISGRGTGLLFKDPLSSLCASYNCKARISLLNENRNRRFVKLSEGNYGFSTTITFTYSIFPNQEGELDLGKVSITFFNPELKNYFTSSAEFPKIFVHPKKQIEVIHEETSSKEIYTKVLFILLTLSSLFLMYRFKEIWKDWLLHFSFLETLSSKIDKFTGKIPNEIYTMDQIIGQKSGSLLKNYLIEKGCNPEEAEKLIQWKLEFENKNFVEIYSRIKNHEKEEIVKLVKEIINSMRRN